LGTLGKNTRWILRQSEVKDESTEQTEITEHTDKTIELVELELLKLGYSFRLFPLFPSVPYSQIYSDLVKVGFEIGEAVNRWTSVHGFCSAGTAECEMEGRELIY